MGEARPRPHRAGGRRFQPWKAALRDNRDCGIERWVRRRDVEVAPLDEILAGTRPTYIKFDVEGAEHDALVGGSETISANMPVLAVCLYHRPEDLWDLPLLVQSLRPDYRLHVRRYSDERWETVLYAVPPDRLGTR